MNRVDVNPKLLIWALSRSRKTVEGLESRCPKLQDWLDGVLQPTVRQLKDFSRATASPFGYLFLQEPPDEPLPVPDFRTVSDAVPRSPSADLLDTLFAMQQRQDWFRNTMVEQDAEPLGFVGSANLDDDPEAIAQEMRAMVGLDDGWTRKVRTWNQAVGELRKAIEETGVLVVINGIVGNNTHRRLDVEEFRGFALSDKYAPLVFVNGADWESAKMFTLAHELAHIWLGEGAVSGFERLSPSENEIEVFCNTAAAEFLVPASRLRELWSDARRTDLPFEYVARHFKVSPIVAARRAMDIRVISREQFLKFFDDYRRGEFDYQAKKKTGRKQSGDFYNSQNFRVGERFGREVVRAAREGRLLYRDAYHLTGLHGATFLKYAEHLGFDAH